MKQYLVAASIVCVAIALYACGNSNSAPSQNPLPAAAPAFATVALASGATTTLPLPDGFAASLTLPVASSSTTAAVVTSTTLPEVTGVRPLPSPGVALFYLAVTPAVTIAFTSGTVSGTLSSPDGASGRYNIDRWAPGVGWFPSSLRTVSGNTVRFNFTLTQPITLTGGTTYVFAISR